VFSIERRVPEITEAVTDFRPAGEPDINPYVDEPSLSGDTGTI
jgi:hypothetical protein